MTAPGAALSTSTRGEPGDVRRAYCGSGGHTAVLCPKTHGGSAARLRCTYCGARDNDIAACPKTWNGRAWHPDSVADHFVDDYL